MGTPMAALQLILSQITFQHQQARPRARLAKAVKTTITKSDKVSVNPQNLEPSIQGGQPIRLLPYQNIPEDLIFPPTMKTSKFLTNATVLHCIILSLKIKSLTPAQYLSQLSQPASHLIHSSLVSLK